MRGGIFLPSSEPVPCRSSEAFGTPSVLTVPLLQHDGSAAVAVVQPGQTVAAGERIGQAQCPDALDVHAPAAGRVTGLVRVDSARAVDIPAVRIEAEPGEPSARDERTAADNRAGLPWSAPGDSAPDPDTLVRAADWAGLTDCRQRVRSLAERLRAAARGGVAHVIINTLSREPIEHGRVEHRWDTLVQTADAIGTAVKAGRVWFAADRADYKSLRSLRRAARGSRVRVAGLVNKYPQHAPVLLAWSILGLETPPGADPLNVGVLVLEAEAVISLAEVLTSAAPAPLTHRRVTVAGPAVSREGVYRIPVGTRFADVLARVGLQHTPKRVIDGGPMTGRAVAHLDAVTTKETAVILAFDSANDHVANPGPCVGCGWCQEDCPVGLDPLRLLDLAEVGDVDEAPACFPQACIECGVCSCVCPAELPLAEAAARLAKARRM